MTRCLVLCLPVILIVCALTSVARFSAADTAQPPSPQEKSAPPESAPTDDEDDGEAMLDPLGPNAACYVCHTTFVFEELARTHLAEKTTCIDCHGLSAAHANDENIGATKPDITYKREQIDTSCQKCHEDHDVPAREVVTRFLERKLKDPKPVCTECHGMHRIDRAEEEQLVPPQTPEPAPKDTDAKAPGE